MKIFSYIYKCIYIIILFIILIPIFLFIVFYKVRIGVTKYSDRFKFMGIEKILIDIDKFEHWLSFKLFHLIWGEGRIAKLCSFIRRLRGEDQIVYDEKTYWDSYKKDQKRDVIILKEQFGIGDGIYRHNGNYDENEEYN